MAHHITLTPASMSASRSGVGDSAAYEYGSSLFLSLLGSVGAGSGMVMFHCAFLAPSFISKVGGTASKTDSRAVREDPVDALRVVHPEIECGDSTV